MRGWQEGRVAAFNLVIASHGVAIIGAAVHGVSDFVARGGSLHSAWMKLQPAFMMAYHKKVRRWLQARGVPGGLDHWPRKRGSKLCQLTDSEAKTTRTTAP